MAETLILKGTMHGHFGRVTAIATPINNSDTIVSCSVDKSVLLWTLNKESANSAETAGSTPYGVPLRRLRGHLDFVLDVVLSSDGKSALSGSCDGDLRLWDLSTGATTCVFVGHTHDVVSVAFSVDNRQIVSASRDNTIKLWNTLGECEHTIQDADGHSDWVSCVRYSPNILQPTLVSGSRDGTVKVWDTINRKLKRTLAGHEGYVDTVAVCPDGSVCASGSIDGTILLWDLAEGERLCSLDASAPIHSLCCSPNRYWICSATAESVMIWDLENKTIVQELKPDAPTSIPQDEDFYCTSLCWSCNGSTLFTGYTDGIIRVWGISRSD